MNFRVKYQRGAQAVEFALVLPFFLALLLLIIDFGFLVYNKAVITNASREAARAGTVLTAAPWTTALPPAASTVALPEPNCSVSVPVIPK